MGGGERNKEKGKREEDEKTIVTLSLLQPGHLLLATHSKHDLLPGRAARDKGIWETRHTFGALPEDGRVRVVDGQMPECSGHSVHIR